jgi:protein-disulfide isomerase
MSKRQVLREKRLQQERTQRIVIIIGMVIIAVALVGWAILAQRPVEGIVSAKPSIERPQVNFNAMGDPNAPVKIIEYSDFQCPYCKKFTDDTEPQIVTAYVKTGKVYFEYHSVGPSSIGAESARAAEAAYCAGDQGKFWGMHDAIFANQGAENSGVMDDSHLLAIAKTVPSLDSAQFESCFSAGKYKDKIVQDGADAKAAGVNSFPSFMINGKLVVGALSFSEFQKEIDTALAATGK